MEQALKKFGLISILLFTSTQLSAKTSKVFFNNDDTRSYVDPYREILKQGANFEQVLVNEINKAKKSIYVAVQEFNLPLLAKSLAAAKLRGVDVRVLLEDSYNRSFARIPKKVFEKLSSHMKSKVLEQLRFLDNNPKAKTFDELSISNKEILDRDAISILKKAGVPIRDDSNGKQQTSSLMHHKFVILDGHVAVISSANFTRSGTHGDFDKAQSIGNANAMIVMDSSEISKHFFEEFKIMWSGVFKKHKPYRGLKAFRHQGNAVGIQFSPTRVSEHGLDKTTNATISRVLKTAKREIVANLFSFTSQRVSDALGATSLRRSGLHVEMLIDPTFATRFYSGLLDMWGVKMRNARNCRYQDDNQVWRNPASTGGKPILRHGDKLHHKFAVVDRETVIFGSHNWSDSADYMNDETLMLIKDQDLAREFIREHNRLYRSANLGPKPELLQKIKDINKKCKARRY